jgi:hypothetical protein
MQVKTIQEVFDWTVQFHTQMAANFFSVRELMGERNVALADYCVDYEKKLAEDLIGFMAISEINTLNTYCYEYFLENNEIVQFTDLDRDQDLNAQAIQEYLSTQHQKVLDVYSYLSDKAQSPEAQEKLNQLHELEEQGLKQMMQSINRHADM